MFTLLSRILSSLAASPTQLLMTLMTFVVGFSALPSAGVVRSRISRRGVGLSGLPGLCRRGGRGAEGGFGGLLLRIRVCRGVLVHHILLGVRRGVVCRILPRGSPGCLRGVLALLIWAESSSASLRVKASSGSGWLSPAAGPAASAVPAASSSCVAAPAAGATAGFAWVPSARAASFRVVSFSLVPSLITISLLVSV